MEVLQVHARGDLFSDRSISSITFKPASWRSSRFFVGPQKAGDAKSVSFDLLFHRLHRPRDVALSHCSLQEPAIVSRKSDWQEAFGTVTRGTIVDEEANLKVKAEELAKDLKGTSIFLIGMMGSGKSTIGRILSKALGYCFFDSDKLVEEAAGGVSVAQIFEECKEDWFRDAESEVLKQLSAMCRVVVATGGGAVIRPENWGCLRHGITVWLDVPLEALAHRVVKAGTETRPLLGKADVDSAYDQAYTRLSKLLKERGQAYENADARVSFQDLLLDSDKIDMETLTPTTIAIKVLEEIQKLLKQEKKGKRMMSF